MRIKKFNESVSLTWEDIFLSIYDSFFELEEKNLCEHIIYHAGVCWIHAGHTSQMNYFRIKNGEIVGDREGFNMIMGVKKDENSLIKDSKFKMLFKVEITPKIVEHSPFKSSYSPSFYGKDANTFIKIIKYTESIKNRHRNYKLDLSISNNDSGLITLIFEER